MASSGLVCENSVNPKQIYDLLPLELRQEIGSTCFRDGLFDPEGKIHCHHDKPFMNLVKQRTSYCNIEFLCDMMAIRILMPRPNWCLSDAELALIYDVSLATVQVARLIGERQETIR